MLITHGGEIVSEEVSLVDVEDAAILQTSLLRPSLSLCRRLSDQTESRIRTLPPGFIALRRFSMKALISASVRWSR